MKNYLQIAEFLKNSQKFIMNYQILKKFSNDYFQRDKWLIVVVCLSPYMRMFCRICLFFMTREFPFLLSIHEKDKKDHRYIIYPYKWLIKWDYEAWLVIPLRKTQAACQVLYRFPSILCKFKVYHQRVSRNSILIGKKSIIFLPTL